MSSKFSLFSNFHQNEKLSTRVFGAKNFSKNSYKGSSIDFLKLKLPYVLYIDICITEKRIWSIKLLKLQIQNMAIFQTQHWALSLWDYHGGTTPGRIFHADAATLNIFSTNIIFLPHSQAIFGSNCKELLEKNSPSRITNLYP